MSKAPSYPKATVELGGEPTHYYAPTVDTENSDLIGYSPRKLVDLKPHELEYIQAIEDLKDLSPERRINNCSPVLKAITQTFIEKDTATMTVTEKEIASISVAPRVTEADVQAAIAKEEFLVTGCLTICVLTLTNGNTITGESACASPANYNKEIGERLSRDNATKKIWPLLGFSLKEKLHLIEKAGPATGAIHEHGSPVTYLGTKVIHAVPMDRLAYNQLRGWELPADENGEDLGYLVQYADGGSPNVPGFSGYVSWSPRDVFERTYDVGIRQTPSTFLDRMRTERDDLHADFVKLQTFLASAAIEKIPAIERIDLQDQAVHMHNYLSVLIRRIARNSQ